MKIGSKVKVIGQSLATPRKGQEGVLVALLSRVFNHPYRVEFPDGANVGFIRKEIKRVKDK